MYYRDPTAEDKGILDGVIDLNGVNSISEVQVARNYGFQTLVSVYSSNIYLFAWYKVIFQNENQMLRSLMTRIRLLEQYFGYVTYGSYCSDTHIVGGLTPTCPTLLSTLLA
jgi:hypothetical protein